MSNSSRMLLSSTTASDTSANARKKNKGANDFMVQRGVETGRMDGAEPSSYLFGGALNVFYRNRLCSFLI